MRRTPTYSGPYRIDPQPRLDFDGELIVDLFAGGGGASTGIEWALGRSPDIAVKHNRTPRISASRFLMFPRRTFVTGGRWALSG
jgi:hypothetical protein